MNDFACRVQVVGALVALKSKLICPESAALQDYFLRRHFHQLQVAADTCPGLEPGIWSTSTTSAPRADIMRARSMELPLDITATNGSP